MSDEASQGGHGGPSGATPGFYAGRHRPAPRSESENAERLVTGAAWKELCEGLLRAGQHVLDGGFAMEAVDYADGFRYLLGLLAAGAQQALAFASPDQPRFFRTPDSRSKWGGENPDNLYLWAHLRPERTYRVTGTLGQCHEILFELHEGFMQLGDARVFGALAGSRMVAGEDGSFEIVLSSERHDGNWLELVPGARYLLVRQYLCDWATERPTPLHIAQVGSEGIAPPPLTPARVAELLDEAGLWTEATAEHWRHWMWAALAGYRRGEIPPPTSYEGGIEGLHYGNGYFVVEEDEAQIIECAVPVARYWQFMLHDNWFESLDYVNHQTSLNGQQLHVDGDGRVRVVIAHRDPGVPNWLDTCGHRTGMVQYRWLWAERAPLPTTKVVELRDLRRHLPADTPRVNAEGRRRAIAIRQEHVTRWREWCW